jgi:hypothetical protein
MAKGLLNSGEKAKINPEIAEKEEKILEWANLFAVFEINKLKYIHNDFVKRKWIWLKCCKSDMRHLALWPTTDFRSIVQPEWNVIKDWAVNNIKVSYITMTKYEVFFELAFLILFKLDFLTDLTYVLTVPMASAWFTFLMWFTIIMPYIWYSLVSCYTDKSVKVKCFTFVTILTNQQHLIMYSHLVDRWAK